MCPEQNHITEEITCVTESNYAGALTYGQIYHILDRDPNKRQIKVQGNNGRIRWFPEECFAFGRRELPRLTAILAIDSTKRSQDITAEVIIALSTGQRRWCFFIMPGGLAQLSGEKTFEFTRLLIYNAPHMIVVDTLDIQEIDKILKYIENQGKLLDCTKLIES